MYSRLYSSVESYKDSLTYKLELEMGGEEALADLKRDQNNIALETILLKRNISEFVERKNRAIQVKVFPIYRNPESNYGRAHFYAPFKSIGQFRFPTLNFNALVILLMTLVLYVALYYNWLGKLFNSWTAIKLRRRK